ncbi:hypothetical protein PJE062_982 [Pseudovibrio sp. JE062]|nr:hypothetical protein PJE062_982 [Pseudovibrio sp. JE062]
MKRFLGKPISVFTLPISTCDFCLCFFYNRDSIQKMFAKAIV